MTPDSPLPPPGAPPPPPGAPAPPPAAPAPPPTPEAPSPEAEPKVLDEIDLLYAEADAANLPELLREARALLVGRDEPTRFTVLVVDDDAKTRLVLRKILEKESCEVVEDDGKTVLPLMVKHHVSLVFLDLQLQGVSGLDLLKKIKTHESLAQVPVCIVSGRKDKETILKAKQEKANDYVIKPFTVDHITGKVKKYRDGVEELVPGRLDTRRLQAMPAAGPADKPTTTTTRAAQKGHLVLVVDDEAMTRKILVKILEKLGCQVTAVTNGREGLLALRDNRFDLVFLDIQMPDIDGLTLCNKMRQVEAFRSLPIVMCSARNAKEDIVAAYRAGATDYVVKPFTSQIIADKLVKHLHHSPEPAA